MDFEENSIFKLQYFKNKTKQNEMNNLQRRQLTAHSSYGDRR